MSSFPDVPEGHWAGEAVERIAALGLIVGFPDGMFRGNEVLTRYQAALIFDRLLRVLEDRPELVGAADGIIEELRDVVADLAARVAAVEARTAPDAADGVEALRDQVAALREEVARLRAEVETLRSAGEPGAPGRPGERGHDGVPGMPGVAGAPGTPGTPGDPASSEPPAAAGEADDPTQAASPDRSDGVDGPFAVVPDEQESTGLVPDGGWSVGLAVAVEPRSLAVRGVVEFPRISEGFGVRAHVDYARRSPVGRGALAVAMHAVYHVDLERATPYVGLGGGWQFGRSGVPGAVAGPFVGALLGIEVPLTPRLGLFAEGTFDYDFGRSADASTPGETFRRLHPTLGIGLAVRF